MTSYCLALGGRLVYRQPFHRGSFSSVETQRPDFGWGVVVYRENLMG